MVSGTEWLEFSDFIEQAVTQRQSYILMGYSPFLSVAFHMFYATQSHSKLSYPSSQYEVSKVLHFHLIPMSCYIQSLQSTFNFAFSPVIGILYTALYLLSVDLCSHYYLLSPLLLKKIFLQSKTKANANYVWHSVENCSFLKTHSFICTLLQISNCISKEADTC